MEKFPRQQIRNKSISFLAYITFSTPYHQLLCRAVGRQLKRSARPCSFFHKPSYVELTGIFARDRMIKRLIKFIWLTQHTVAMIPVRMISCAKAHEMLSQLFLLSRLVCIESLHSYARISPRRNAKNKQR
jgi:hypothetical protein